MAKLPLTEANKNPGVHYALTSDDIELPVVDITHPAFALTVTDSEQRELVQKFLREGLPIDSFPKPLRNLFLRFFLRGSILARGIRQAQGTFMTGMHTYLMKLGPQMLGDAYTKTVDRQIAAALPALGVRLRLQDIARLTADTLLPSLSSDRHRPLHFVNIAGGPGIDSLNTLILLSKQPGILTERQISIDVLDLDDAGPAFGQSALAALSDEGAPLREIQIAFRHVRYDWAKVEDLKLVLHEAQAKRALVICSSEGGLFEYGSDHEIEANLKTLRAYGEVLAVVGSVTRADEPAQRLYKTSAAAIHLRGLDVFRPLVQKTSWNITRVIERPFGDQFVLM